MIYKRFTEKSAEEWRQIYKALQLMEFLVKNGSERVIDDARAHLSLLKMLRQFHFIDANGKDQGLNVRNRSKELTDLLGDVERIRSERKKSRTTRNKYAGVEGGTGLGAGSFGSGGGGRYGGFEGGSGAAPGSFGGQTRGVYGDGGGFGGETHDEYDEGGRTNAQERFEEYDEFDDGGAQAAPGRRKADAAASSSKRAAAPVKKAEPPKPKAPEVDLFEFGDDEPAAAAPAFSAPAFHQTSAPAAAADDDDFDDFQSAAPTSAPAPAPIAAPALPKPNYSSFSAPLSTATTGTSGFTSPPAATPNYSSSAFSSPAAQTQTMTSPKPSGYQPSGPNYFTSVPVPTSASTPGASAGQSNAFAGIGSSTTAKKPAGGDAFASLLSGSGKKSAGGVGGKGLTMADLAREKSQAGLYGAPASSGAGNSGFAMGGAQKPSSGSSGLDDLLG